MASSQPTHAYMPQLDSLRAVAVATVMLWHFGSRSTHAREFAVAAGVRLFFVLSGFLITGVLLRARQDDPRETTWSLARRFYARRALRIAPVYYLTLLMAFAAGQPDVQNGIWWHVTYLSNVRFALLGHWEGATSHLWSLGVEEQFYFVWPWVVLLLPRRHLRPILVVAVASAPVARIIALALHQPGAIDLLPIGCFDSLGCGALVCVAWDELRAHRRLVAAICGTSGAIAAVLIAGVVSGPGVGVATGTLLSIALMWIVARAAEGFGGAAGAALSFSPLRYIGKISYGMYLFHGFMPGLLSSGAALFGVSIVGVWPRVCLLVALTTACAALSWELFESPINQLKQRFTSVRSTFSPAGALV